MFLIDTSRLSGPLTSQRASTLFDFEYGFSLPTMLNSKQTISCQDTSESPTLRVTQLNL